MSSDRKVISAESVSEASNRKRKRIEVLPGDIVTAEARERAERLGIELADGPLEKPLPVATDGATAMLRGLWRRSPGWVAPKSRISRSPRRFRRIAFAGMGGVGTNSAHLCANANMADELILIDITPGLAESTALDLNHASGVTRTRSRCEGGTSLSMAEDADVVVVSAGRPRQAGMSRTELFDINRRIIHTVGESIASNSPNAVVIVITNPLDEMTLEMLRVTGFQRNRVIGMAGTLDSSRFRNSLAMAAGVGVEDVEAVTLGSHGEEMVPVASRSRIKGRPLDVFLDREQVSACVRETIGGGGRVVELRKSGSAVIAPAHSTVELLDHIRGARRGWVPASVMLEGEYGIDGLVLGVPCNLGMTGLIEVVELKLNRSETEALNAAANAIRERVESNAKSQT